MVWLTLLAGCSQELKNEDFIVRGQTEGVFAQLEKVQCAMQDLPSEPPTLEVNFRLEDYPGLGRLRLRATDWPPEGGERKMVSGPTVLTLFTDDLGDSLEDYLFGLSGADFGGAGVFSIGGPADSVSGVPYTEVFLHELRFPTLSITARNGDSITLPESYISEVVVHCFDYRRI